MRIRKRLVIALIVVICLFIIAWPLYFIYSRTLMKTEASVGEQPALTENAAPSQEAAPVSEQVQTPETEPEETPVDLEPMTIAIYGSDARSTETARSDVILLLKYNPADHSIDMVSIPRDTRVEITDRGKDKINHAYAFGGAELMTETIENLFETTIDNYFIFNFDDFSDIVDKLGGVQVNAEKDFYNSDDYLVVPQGLQTLDGYSALFYVRYRSDDEGDYGRIRRQQEVIQSLYQKLFESKDSDWEKTIIEIFAEDLETNIELQKLIEYDTLFDSPEKITFNKYMLENSGKIIDKIWYGIIDEESLAAIKGVLSK